jgi:hypothetical protein
MAKLPSFKRILTQDFPPDNSKLVEKLALLLNSSFDAIFNSLNNRITLNDNLAATVKDVTLRVDSNGTPNGSVGFKLDRNFTVLEVRVGRVDNNTNSALYPPAAVFVSWTQTNDFITIDNVRGLSTGNTYTLRLIAQG